MKTLYLVRHGETDYNRKRIVQGRGIDSDLNATGRAQAQALWAHYRTAPIERVITSSLKRTHQTAQHFIQSGLPWEATPLIDEISWGIHEGAISTPQNALEYQALVQAWSDGDYQARLPKAESAQDLADRLQEFVQYLTQQPETHFLICSHGRTLCCLITLLQQLPLAQMRQFRIENTSVSKGLFLPPTAIQFEFINDLTHLAP